VTQITAQEQAALVLSGLLSNLQDVENTHNGGSPPHEHGTFRQILNVAPV
jgi:hypothetical protein